MELKADLHIHSEYSFDCRLKLEEIARQAVRRGLDIVAVTDHGTLEGSLRLREQVASSGAGLQVVVGCEITTEAGDILGLFLEREIRSSRALDVIAEIKDMGGVSVLAHPYRAGEPSRDVLEAVDAVEIYNGRSSKVQNYLAQVLALRLQKPGLSGSDAHVPDEVGCAYTLLDDMPEIGKASFKGCELLNSCLGVRLNV
ncbi:PHP domain-containing protein [bacterium]|nr:PHP domain-containing protein [bacterium]